MTDQQVFAVILLLSAAMVLGFFTGYFSGRDQVLEKIENDPTIHEWYRWPKVKVGLHDRTGDYALARKVNHWLEKNVHEKHFKIHVMDDVNRSSPPNATFYIKDRNIALTLSIKYNITYVPGYGEGYQ